MDFARPLLWNVPHWAEVALYVLTAVVVVTFLVGLWRRVARWRLGRSEFTSETFWSRVKRVAGEGLVRRLRSVLRDGLFQWRLSSDPLAIGVHLAIFWGMVVLFIGTALATIDQDVTHLLFGVQFLSGNVYRAFELALDVFGLMLIVGLVAASIRRFVFRPARLATAFPPTFRWDSAALVVGLLLIAVSGFVAEGLRIAEGMRIAEQDPSQAPWMQAAPWAPVGWLLAWCFRPLSSDAIQVTHQVVWWVHALLAMTFVAAIPFTKAFHLISSPVNMFFRNPAPAGRLAVAAESGVSTVRDFTWRQLLAIDACTWCGKCQEVCPWFAAGSPLSPRDLIQKLGGALVRARVRGANGQADEDLHAAAAPAQELWSCCTCRACEEACPVFVEQPAIIIDLRRRLVDQGKVDEGLQDALINVQRYGNSFGQSPRKRADWAKSLGLPLKDARKDDVDCLWFLGDYAAYDQRVQEVTRATARVFHEAGLDVGVLFDKEQNAGNDVRRVGEEGLFDMLREKNLAALEKANFRRIVTTDPHTYNTLKNEYAAADGPAGTAADGAEGKPASDGFRGKPVVHHAELFDELLREGKLVVRKRLGHTATYHDPCYLGRYNGVYDAPRRVLETIGVSLTEMPRNRAGSFCCGAGGGRIWMKDAPGAHERPAEQRIREALALPGVEYFVVACPKDLAMFQDAVKTVGEENRLRVVDLGQLVCEAVCEAAANEAASESKS